ncbi:5'-methylthioadenosine/S-adenosylhomocysteine nucleosidase [Actinoplanes sp. TBRC 11911]|uniref:5'-methylthioadenosine/S-adenosylhomocysteine nucleosidase family protein n=1 Tax=Actinoplanes sp. TBRC 11911 TaxID=2729386 RepID=UPI00145F277C|nr:hypothetical protein [Actinoplanes sp. TBRC 11911]NMO57812.1 5'-methylthioadenosine/S-adenosylhomocysteine nucleosidase [Actinoplanes sp. TBRC 11911]
MTLVDLDVLGTAPSAARAELLAVAALPFEFRSAIQVLGPCVSHEAGIARTKIVDRLGNAWRLEIVLVSSMGAVPAALVTQEALGRTKAPHVVLLGIAAGVPDRVKLGDVVIPEQILYYESQKLTETAAEGAPSWRATDERVRVAASVMPSLIGLQGKTTSVAVHTDVVIASGEKVVASQVFRDTICSAHRRAVALDTESYGVARAAERGGSRVTIIKSICDFADSAKNDEFHEFGALASATVFRNLVYEGAFRRSHEEPPLD